MHEKAVQLVPCPKIRARKNIAARHNQEEDAGLEQSIRENGILVPLLLERVSVEGSEETLFEIIDGHRRFAAARALGQASVPAIVDPRQLSAAESLQRQVVANSQRLDHAPIATATAIRDVIAATGWSQEEVARKLGFSPGKVSRLLALLELPESVQDEVAAGTLPVSSAYQIARAGDAASQEQLAEAARNGVTREGLAEKVRGEKRGSGRSALPKVTCALGGGRSVTLAGSGLVTLTDLIQWVEELLAKARKERKVRGDTLDLATFCSLLRGDAKAGSKKANTPDAADEDDSAATAVSA